jgi:hypothetical protein
LHAHPAHRPDGHFHLTARIARQDGGNTRQSIYIKIDYQMEECGAMLALYAELALPFNRPSCILSYSGSLQFSPRRHDGVFQPESDSK